MPGLRGKTAGGDSKNVLKERIIELQNLVRNRDAEISRLMHRVTFVELENNKTQSESEFIKSKHFIRNFIMLKFTKDVLHKTDLKGKPKGKASFQGLLKIFGNVRK